MKYEIEVRPNAIFETSEGFEWYESQREGLGYEFLEEVETFYEGLSGNPFTCSFFEEAVRQGVLKRFPYCVVYEVFENVVVVYHVFMTSQDPSKKRTK